MTLRAQALSGFRWTASVRLASQVITWAITLVVIRLLAPADYGLLAMATVFISFLAMFSEFGLGPALVQKADLDVRALRQAFGIILIINLSLAAILILAAPLIGAFFAEPRVIPVVRVLALQFIVGAFDVIPGVLLQRRMEFRKLSLLDLAGAVVGSVITLLMALNGAGVWALVLGAMVSQIWRTIGINWLSPFFHKPDFSVQGMRSLLAFGGRLTVAGAFGMLFSQVDIIIGAKLLGNEVLGVYSVAMQLAALPSQKIAGLVNYVAFPTFSRMQHDLHKVALNVLIGVRVLSFFGFPVMWGVSSIAPEIVEIALGPKWTASAVPLQVLALIIPLRIIGNFLVTAVQGLGRLDIVLQNSILALAVGPPLLFLGAYSGGVVGLSLAWLVVSPFLFLVFVTRSAIAIGLRPMQILAAMVPAGGAGFVMYGAVMAARYIVADDQDVALRMCILIAVGALAYCAVSFGRNRKATLEVLEVVRSIAVPQRA